MNDKFLAVVKAAGEVCYEFDQVYDGPESHIPAGLVEAIVELTKALNAITEGLKRKMKAEKIDWQTYRISVSVEVDATSKEAAEKQIAEILKYVRITAMVTSQIGDNASVANKYGVLSL